MIRVSVRVSVRVTVKFLKWDIPYREEIDLEFSDIMLTLDIPFALSTVIDLPFPSAKSKTGFSKESYQVKFSKVKLKASDNLIHLRSEVNFKRK